MDYMDQSVKCTACGTETSNITISICRTCERTYSEAKRKAEWDSKSDEEKALSYLESWANPTHMTFDRDHAAFVLKVFRAARAGTGSAGSEDADVKFKRLVDVILRADNNVARNEALREMASLFDTRATKVEAAPGNAGEKGGPA